MNRRNVIGLLLVFFVIGTVAGVFIALFVWNTHMEMILVVDSEELYGLRLEYYDGTPMTEYDWGIFSSGETKVQNATLNYTGSVDGNVTWNSTLPAGWSIAIWVWPNIQQPAGTYWPANGVGTMPSGATCDIRIELTEAGATEGVPYEFNLRWYSGPP